MQSRVCTAVSNTSHFNRELISLVIAIALQNLITAAVMTVDIVMLGVVSQSAMSAVSLAGQITFVLTLFYMGLATGAGILTAQYWGKRDVVTIGRVLSIACLFSVSVSLIFFGLSLIFPEMLMRFFTNDEELVRYGASFLQVISFSYLAMGISQMYFSVIRSMENARLSAWICSVCLILNILFNALCIFVLYPNEPEKAIQGIALSTVCARFFELGCCILHAVKRGRVKFQLSVRDSVQGRLLQDYLRYTMPVQGNFIVWGCALTATAAIIGHVNADLVAANSVASVVKNLAIVICGGIASGGAVLIGKYLGNGESEKAKKAGNRISLYSLVFGSLAGLTIVLMKPLVFTMVNLNEAAQGYLTGMLYICAYYCAAKSFNSTTIGGIFCAGGMPSSGSGATLS